MTLPSPILPLLEAADALLRSYGDAPEGHSAPALLAEQIVELELEYAAIRKHAALLDQPNRGVIVVTGSDRLDFLGRMVTQEVKSLSLFQWRHSFWLNRKGRIDADMRVMVLPDRVLLDMDIHAVARTMAGLNTYIITEEVTLADATQQIHRLALHGPAAISSLASVVGHAQTAPGSSPTPSLQAISQGSVVTCSFGGSIITIARDDSAGETGLEILVPTEQARPMYEALLALAHEHAPAAPAPEKPAAPSLRPIGWHAYNIARIEAGTPLYNLDFGPSNLPHETGDHTLRSRVSFKKGCYLGQEIVARMDARGHPKVVLAALALEGPDARDAEGTPRQPVTGAPIFATADAGGEPIGVVTSSTVSPMRSSTPICFAMVRHAYAVAGAELHLPAEGVLVSAKVQVGPTFWRRA
jgi:folate-binding protein YgfZ